LHEYSKSPVLDNRIEMSFIDLGLLRKPAHSYYRYIPEIRDIRWSDYNSDLKSISVRRTHFLIRV